MINMTNSRTIYLFGLAVLASLALTSCYAAKPDSVALVAPLQPAQQHQTSTSHHSSLASKFMPNHSKARTSRSLSDMFEKVRSKIFGSRKQATSGSSSSVQSPAANSQIQPSASSSNMVQRSPWVDQLNSFNQQFSPYNYQWSSGSSSSSNQFPQFSSVSSSYPTIIGAQPSSSSSNGAFSNFMNPSNQLESSSLAFKTAPNFDMPSITMPANSNSASSNSAGSGGLLSSASHLIAQYLSPGSSAGPSSQQAAASSGPQQQQNLLSPQQQQQQSQYNEFASILDSMVAQTGANQKQPNMNQYLNQNQAVAQPNYQPGSSAQAASMMGQADNDMSGSSNIQSYLPAGSAALSSTTGSQPAASQKSSMVNLAEQLAPGANFNKLVSFPFSLSNNDDPSKEGRYKLHIPFLNQHVKRSDQQQVGSSSTINGNAKQQQEQQQRLAQQYISYFNNQMAVNQMQMQQQPANLLAQPSQSLSNVLNPQSAIHSPVLSSSPVASSSASSSSQPQSNSINQQSSISQSVSSLSSPVAASAPQSSVSMLSSPNNPSLSSSAVAGSQSQQNSRPSWSVADLQSSASSSKLIPMPSSASSSSSVDLASSSQN